MKDLRSVSARVLAVSAKNRGGEFAFPQGICGVQTIEEGQERNKNGITSQIVA